MTTSTANAPGVRLHRKVIASFRSWNELDRIYPPKLYEDPGLKPFRKGQSGSGNGIVVDPAWKVSRVGSESGEVCQGPPDPAQDPVARLRHLDGAPASSTMARGPRPPPGRSLDPAAALPEGIGDQPRRNDLADLPTHDEEHEEDEKEEEPAPRCFFARSRASQTFAEPDDDDACKYEDYEERLKLQRLRKDCAGARLEVPEQAHSPHHHAAHGKKRRQNEHAAPRGSRERLAEPGRTMKPGPRPMAARGSCARAERHASPSSLLPGPDPRRCARPPRRKCP